MDLESIVARGEVLRGPGERFLSDAAYSRVSICCALVSSSNQTKNVLARTVLSVILSLS